MTHAGFPSLLSLDLSSHLQTEKWALRRWTAGSFIFHLVVVLIALNLRFTPDIQQPLSSYEVSLVSLPTVKATTPSQSKTKASPKKAPAKKAPPKAQEKPLPPLTTKMASERLSKSLSGAVKSVVVPDKLVSQEPADPPPVVKTSPGQPLDLKDIKLPSEAPTLAPVQPLEPAKPVKEPDAPPKEPIPAPTATSQPKPPPPKPNLKDTLKEIKAPPKAPELASVHPFTKTQEVEPSSSAPEPVSQALKEKVKSIQVPAPSRKPLSSPKKRAKRRPPVPPPPTQTPQPSELAKASAPKKELPPPKPRERLSDSLKQMLESVKVPQLRDVSKPDPSQPSASQLPLPKPVISPRDTAESEKFRTEIDEQLAKLTVPEVAPIESIRTRLQVEESLSDSADSNVSGQPQSSRNTAGQNRYLALVQAHIDRQWVAPPVKAHEKNLQVVLKFRILRSGKVIDLDIAQGSGNSYYDAAALRAVQAASPLPPFPSDIHQFSFDVRYNFILGEPTS